MTDLHLPTGLTARSLTLDDTHAAWQVAAAQEAADIGRVEIDEADLVGDWQRPSFDTATSTVGVFDGDLMVGYAELLSADRGGAGVHPDHRRRGVGTWLAAWMREAARARGATTVGGSVPEGSPGDVLLASLGYGVRWTSWMLKLPAGARVPERGLPDGYAVRAAEEREYRAAHAVVDAAFLEWSVREPESFDDFTATTVGRPGFEPWHLRVVTDPAGDVVAVAVVQLYDTDDGLEASIARLATRRDQRGQGLAQALMVDTFAVARGHGAVVCGLSTDSRTGALGLYEKVGMRPTSTWVSRAIDL